MSATLTTYFLLSHFDTATVADNTLIADALVLTAGALVILRRTEDALAEQTVTLGLVGAIVDGLWLGNLAKRILKNLFRRCQSNGNLKLFFIFESFLKAIIFKFQFSMFNFISRVLHLSRGRAAHGAAH
jgi:hypothetical protein